MTVPEASHGDQRRMGELAPGTRIGRYRLESVVGRGGMGTVYRAFDAETRREVAVKILRPDLPESLRERFLAECDAEARIRHPHVMPVYDRGTYDRDRLYFVMELVYEPITLTELVEVRDRGRLAQTWPRLRQWADPKRLVADVFLPICEGVGAANREYGILHRDLKPDNVLIDVRTRRAYLIDFGICHQEGAPVEKDKIVGTPRFLAPEQARADVSPTTDVFGLGALLYYVLAGHPPIATASPLRRDEKTARIRELTRAQAEARAAGDGARA
ncbi:MAG: serine/threonine-protein kinase, partial [Planctomycetota bacterium]